MRWTEAATRRWSMEGRGAKKRPLRVRHGLPRIAEAHRPYRPPVVGQPIQAPVEKTQLESSCLCSEGSECLLSGRPDHIPVTLAVCEVLRMACAIEGTLP